MGLRRRWAFDKIDWDKEIAEGNVYLDPRDFSSINTTELVEILRLRGIRAHRGTPRDDLIHMLTNGQVHEIVNRVDRKREALMAFMSANWHKIRDQVMPQCHGDCYKHHDLEVTVCHHVNRTFFEEE